MIAKSFFTDNKGRYSVMRVAVIIAVIVASLLCVAFGIVIIVVILRTNQIPETLLAAWASTLATILLALREKRKQKEIEEGNL